MVKEIRQLGMEVCTTLGMLTPEQALELRTAGLTAYNHNLDTSPEFYPKVTSSRKYQVSEPLLAQMLSTAWSLHLLVVNDPPQRLNAAEVKVLTLNLLNVAGLERR